MRACKCDLGKRNSSRVKAFRKRSRACGRITAQLVVSDDGDDCGSLRHNGIRNGESEAPLLSWLRTTPSLGKGACLNTRKLYTFDTVRLMRRYRVVSTKIIETFLLLHKSKLSLPLVCLDKH